MMFEKWLRPNSPGFDRRRLFNPAYEQTKGGDFRAQIEMVHVLIHHLYRTRSIPQKVSHKAFRPGV